MRAGGCTLQQALTQEATSIVKQAVTLAKRRGHAQVTPLHVASTMLSSSTGLLRAACLQSHSHPLQCKALELCFNVALNRLPASTSSTPMLGPHHHHHHQNHHHPSLSNALVAAFKRAQAHQRRGSIESQQQPLLAVKIEIEQLIISILDDPSVSRVMREAGFSSTQVKSNVEQALSLEICTPSPSNANANSKSNKEGINNHMSFLSLQPIKTSSTTRPLDPPIVRNEDVMSVVEFLISRRNRSVVVVGECLVTTEGVVRGMMDKVERGEVPEPLRNVQFISLPLFSFARLSKDEVEQKVGELRCLVKSCCVGKGAVLYLGDLKWAAEYRASCSGEKGRNYYCPVEHVIMELGRLVCSGIGEGSGGGGGRFWFMGIATYQTYMRCRVGHPSLETLWALHPLTIPAGSLGLSLSHDSYLQNPLRNKRSGDGSHWCFLEDGVEDNQLKCYVDCSMKSDNNGTQTLPSNATSSIISSSLPSWLQQYKEESKRAATSDQEGFLPSRNHQFKKWHSTVNTSHKQLPEIRTLNFSSSEHRGWPVPINAKYPWREHQFWISETVDECQEQEHKGPRLALLGQSNPNPNPISTSSSETMEMEYHHRFKELNAENLKTLCKALEEKVPWQMDIIPEIASTILQCRSGMVRRKERTNPARTKEDTWLFFQGCDTEGKEKISRKLANLVFGSYTNFVSIGLSNFSSTKSDSSDDLRNRKRSRSEAEGNSYLDRLCEEIRNNPHRVFLMEEMEQVDYCSQMGIKAAMERGKLRGSDGDDVALEDAIVILCCESFDSRSRACSPPTKQKVECEEEKEVDCEKEAASSCASLDLNLSAAGDGEVDDDQCSMSDVGLVESVDRSFFFKMRVDL